MDNWLYNSPTLLLCAFSEEMDASISTVGISVTNNNMKLICCEAGTCGVHKDAQMGGICLTIKSAERLIVYYIESSPARWINLCVAINCSFKVLPSKSSISTILIVQELLYLIGPHLKGKLWDKHWVSAIWLHRMKKFNQQNMLFVWTKCDLWRSEQWYFTNARRMAFTHIRSY